MNLWQKIAENWQQLSDESGIPMDQLEVLQGMGGTVGSLGGPKPPRSPWQVIKGLSQKNAESDDLASLVRDTKWRVIEEGKKPVSVYDYQNPKSAEVRDRIKQLSSYLRGNAHFPSEMKEFNEELRDLQELVFTHPNRSLDDYYRMRPALNAKREADLSELLALEKRAEFQLLPGRPKVEERIPNRRLTEEIFWNQRNGTRSTDLPGSARIEAVPEESRILMSQLLGIPEPKTSLEAVRYLRNQPKSVWKTLREVHDRNLPYKLPILPLP